MTCYIGDVHMYIATYEPHILCDALQLYLEDVDSMSVITQI